MGNPALEDDEPTIDFVTMGMFIIDEIYRDDGTELGNDLAGGAGTYALIGARFFYQSPLSKRVSMIIDIGNDFPTSTLDSLTALNCSLLLRHTPERRTSRGHNLYGPGELRNFKYLTPKLRLDADDLSPQLLASKTFHMICNPTRARSMVNNILSRRQKHGIKEKPMFLWEPVPGVCSPNDWADCIEAMKVVDVISPNINEAAGFLGRTIDEEQPFGNFKIEVEDLAHVYTSHLTHHSAVVFRCGKHGCLVATTSEMSWLPAYHQSKDKVVDPTGGGNAFCGGFCAGWIHSGGDFVAAARYGNVAASFVIEQFGLPRLDYLEGVEIWNTDTAEKRLKSGTDTARSADLLESMGMPDLAVMSPHS